MIVVTTLLLLYVQQCLGYVTWCTGTIKAGHTEDNYTTYVISNASSILTNTSKLGRETSLHRKTCNMRDKRCQCRMHRGSYSTLQASLINVFILLLSICDQYCAL